MSILSRLRFSLWYYFRPPWDSGISPPELLAFLEGRSPGRAIDLGCGTGTNVITLAQHGWQAVGVDFAPRAIVKARKKAKQAGVSAQFLVGDVTRLARPSTPYDFALDLGCFHGLSEKGQTDYLDNLDFLLAPGGYWLLYAFLRPDDADYLGLADADLEQIQTRFSLISRQDGFDRRQRSSAYLLLQKPEKE